MNQATRLVLLATAVTASLSAQSVLSDFTGPSPDGWTGIINGVTTFPNGSTAASGVTESGNDVLQLSDGGFGAARCAPIQDCRPTASSRSVRRPAS